MEKLRLKQSKHAVGLLLFLLMATVQAYNVEVKSTGSSVIGGTVNFSAFLYDDGPIASEGNYKFNWEDNTHVHNKMEISTKYPNSTWSVTYPMNTTKPGDYRVTLQVEKDYILWIPVASNHIDYKLDDSLGGEMLLLQNDTKRKKDFVSTAKPVNHTIQMRPSDAKLLAEKAYEVQTHWFRNCTYIGVINGLSYVAQYTEPEQNYKIEAVVVATFEKPPEPTTLTTTTTTTTTTTPKPTTTTPTTTTTTSTSTTPKPNTTTTATTPKTPSANATTTLPAHRQRRSAAAPIPLAMLVADQPSPSNPAELAALALNSSNHTDSIASSSTNAALASKKLTLPILMSPLWMGEEPPYNCVSGQFIQRDPKKLYGLFKHYAVTKPCIASFDPLGC